MVHIHASPLSAVVFDCRMLTRFSAVGLLALAPLVGLHAAGARLSEPVVKIRFVDSATGRAIVPGQLEARPPAGGVSQRWAGNQLTSGRAKLNLAVGPQTLTASSAGYRSMSCEFEMTPENAYGIVFHLDPIAPPQMIQPEYLSRLHRVNETLFVGYVSAEETGEPLVGAIVRAEPSGRETTADPNGYFQMYVPVQTHAEALSSPARLGFTHPGYRGVEHRYLELWSEGDWVYRIQLQPGNGKHIVDERPLRRRPEYPIRTPESVGESGVETSDVATTVQSQSFELQNGGPVAADDSTAPALRIPRNIRVLRQDGFTIDYISLQTYCQRSLPSEWIASWGNVGPGNSGTNSLNAGAVAIRTYAIGFINNPRDPNYDICGTTSCQAYNHNLSHSRTTAAVNFTVNHVMNQPGAARIGFKLTEYSAENNSLGFACGDGYTQPSGGCLYDPVCTGESRFGHGRGMCQWGTARWSTGRRMQGRVTSDSVTNNFPLQDWIWLCEHYYPELELVQGAPLMIDDYVQVLGTSSLTVRRCADGGISSGTGCPQITTKASGATGILIGGPVRITSDGVGYTWWQVQWLDGGSTVGWSPENWLERITQPASVPPVLAPIDNVTVDEGVLLVFTNSATAPSEAITTLTEFEGFADGTANGTVLFRAPSFSGSTSSSLDPSPNLTSVTGAAPVGNDSARVLRANWSWNGTPDPWLRLTTFNVNSLPNPVLDLSRKLSFDLHTDKAIKVGVGIREVVVVGGTPIGSDGGTSGAIEQAGVNPGSGAREPVRTVSAGGWTNLVFDLPTEPVRAFTGNGVLSTASGLAALEHLIFVPAAGSGAYDVHLDNFVVSAPNTLTYSLSNAPAGAIIDPVTGVFTWTPSEIQGPDVYDITVVVTDNNLPAFSDSKTFQVTVNEVNLPPVLAAISNRTVHAGMAVTFTNSASDPDLPANVLSYSLDPGAPAGASVELLSGVFEWLTGAPDAGTTNPVTVRVTDDGIPPLSDTQSFSIAVLAPPTVTGAAAPAGEFVLRWSSIPGTRYRVQYKNDLVELTWTDAVPDQVAQGSMLTYTNEAGVDQRFFRVEVLP